MTMKEDRGIPMKCQICGAPGHAVAEIPFFRRVTAACNACQTDGFWLEKVLMKYHPDVVRVDGQHYMLAEHRAPKYGGKHRVRFHDGRSATTRKLWQQGVIPDKFRRALPDNAVLVPACGDSSGLSCIPLHCDQIEGHSGRHTMGYLAWHAGGPTYDLPAWKRRQEKLNR